MPSPSEALAHAEAGRWCLVAGHLHLDDAAQRMLGLACPALPFQDWLAQLALTDAHRVQGALAPPARHMSVGLRLSGQQVTLSGGWLPGASPPWPETRGAAGRLQRTPHRLRAQPRWQGLMLSCPAEEVLHPPSLSARDEFVASISHELRTPLNAILGFNRLARADGAPPQVQRHLDHINDASRVMLHVVNDLLDLARLEAGRLDIDPDQALNVPALLSRVGVLAHGLLHERPVAVYTTMDPACPPHLRGDVTRIEQVLNNLVGNALKFTHQGSVAVGVKVRLLQNDQVTLRWSVADTGVGIAPDQLGRMGKAFHQDAQTTSASTPGTGLGLAVVRRLLELHGTQLRLASVPGGGTIAWFDLTLPLDCCPRAAAPAARTAVFSNNLRFIDTIATQWAARGLGLLPRDAHAQASHWVIDSDYPGAEHWLAEGLQQHRNALLVSALPQAAGGTAHPLATAASAALDHQARATVKEQAQPAQLTQQSLHGLRVLVLEDNPLNQQVIKEFLQRLGAEVTLVADSHQALQRIAASAPGTAAFDVALFDIQLPGENGLATARSMRNMPAGQQLPLVFLSAHLDLQDRLEASELGALGCLVKPFESETLLQLLQHVPRLGRRPHDSRATHTKAMSSPAPHRPAHPHLRALFTQQWPTLRPALAQPATADDLMAAVHGLRGSLSVLGQPDALRLARSVEEGLRAGQKATEGPLQPLLQQLLKLTDALAEG